MPIISNFPMGGNTDEIEQLIGEHNSSADAHKEQFDKQKEYTDAARTITRTVTLTVAGWSDNEQTVTCEGVLADEDKQQIIVMPASKSGSAWASAVVKCVSQAENTLKFTCNTVPTEDITVYVNMTLTAYQFDVDWDPSEDYPFGDITPAEMREKIGAASTEDLKSYLPLAGGEMTGSVTMPNGSYIANKDKSSGITLDSTTVEHRIVDASAEKGSSMRLYKEHLSLDFNGSDGQESFFIGKLDARNGVYYNGEGTSLNDEHRLASMGDLSTLYGEVVPKTRKINGTPLSSDVTLTAAQVEAMPIVPVYLAKTDNVLNLAPGRYRYEGSDDEQTTTMNLPQKAWHWEITVIAQANIEGTTNNYKVITAVSSTGDIYLNSLNWDAWSGWTEILRIDSSGNLQITSDLILPHGMTVNGWSNFEQIRIKNFGNPFECGQYIDFHAVGSDVDYTTRIYADKTGVLRMAEAVPAGECSIRPSALVSSEQTPGATGNIFWQYG